LNLTTLTELDAQTGQVTAARQPGGTTTASTDASWKEVVYYKATAPYTAADELVCNSTPALADQICVTRPGGQPGGTLPELPVVTHSYDTYLNPTVVTEKVAGATVRTTTTTYDAGERVTTVEVTGTLGQATPKTRNIYDATTGQNIRTETIDPATSAVTNEIVRVFDANGRITSYKDGIGTGGVTSTTTYDLLDRPLVVNDGKQTTTFVYETAAEPRGLVTQKTTNLVSGTPTSLVWSALYDADGALVDQTLPNNTHQCTTLDETGTATAQKIVAGTCAAPSATWLQETISESVHGQWRTRAATLGLAGFASGAHTSNQTYTYDNVGRLTNVADTYDGACRTRTYGFDANSNRTSLLSRSSSTTTCPTTGGTTQLHTYDIADRITDAGYTYDALGRILTVPAVDAGTSFTLTNTYHTNDLVRSMTRGSSPTVTRTWSLDPNQRLANWSDTADGLLRTNHFSDDSDSPTWIAENTATSTDWTRNIEDIAGNLAAIETQAGATHSTALQYSGLHGDVFASGDIAEAGFGGVFENTEFGVLRAGAALTRRFQWLGAKQRQNDRLTRMTLMGVRVYAPGLGRFLQVDPVPGGSASSYDYCSADPINCYDLDGQFGLNRSDNVTKPQRIGNTRFAKWVGRNRGTIATVASFTPVAGWGVRGGLITRSLVKAGVPKKIAAFGRTREHGVQGGFNRGIVRVGYGFKMRSASRFRPAYKGPVFRVSIGSRKRPLHIDLRHLGPK
jgi:RHS repeat-associated protein